MKRPARRKKVNKGVLAAIGGAVLGVAAGATALFLSKKENREVVVKKVKTTVRKGKAQVAKVKRKLTKKRK